jgi:hypothetical protein
MSKMQPSEIFVFKPLAHVVVSFRSAEDEAAAVRALEPLRLAGGAITRYSPQQMLAQLSEDVEGANAIAHAGQELNLLRAQHVPLDSGYHWLVVRAPDDDLARWVIGTVKVFGAERARRYDSVSIEELIESTAWIPESADRAPDAYTRTSLQAKPAQAQRPAG